MKYLTAAKARRYQEAIADVMCWLKGFYMAKGDEADMPPGWRRLGDLGADLLDHAEEQEKSK